jgi:hypothetical protein
MAEYIWQLIGVRRAVASGKGLFKLVRIDGRPPNCVALSNDDRAATWAACGAGMTFNAWRSDHTQERYWHFALPALISAIGLGMAASASGATASAWLVVGACFIGAALGAFWPIPTTFLSGAVVSIGLTLVNMAGNAAGVVTPPLIGWLSSQTPP